MTTNPSPPAALSIDDDHLLSGPITRDHATEAAAARVLIAAGAGDLLECLGLAS